MTATTPTPNAVARTHTFRDGTFVTKPHRPAPASVPSHPGGSVDADAILATVAGDPRDPQRVSAGVWLGLTLARHTVTHRDVTGASFRALAVRRLRELAGGGGCPVDVPEGFR